MIYTIHLNGHENIKYQAFSYPAGETQVRLDKEEIRKIQDADEIRVVVRGLMRHEMQLALLTDAIQYSLDVKTPIHLIMPYLPYSRADRRFVEGDCLGLKVFGSFINDLRYDKVVTLDVHSHHAYKLVANLININPQPLVEAAISMMPDHEPVILLPDGGALLRYGNRQDIKFLFSTKHRDPKTGKLSGFSVPPKEDFGDANSVLIVDDICDGGGTFLGIAEAMKDHGLDLYLYVTHGIFSQGFNKLGSKFKKIFTSDSFGSRSMHEAFTFKTESLIDEALKTIKNS